MKMMSAILSLLFTATAFANGPVSQKVSHFTELDFDGKDLEFSYSTGGGCQTHTPKVQVQISEIPTANQFHPFEYVAQVEIFDTTSAADPCEAIVYVEEEVNLQELVKNTALMKGIETYSIKVRLPEFSVSTH